MNQKERNALEAIDKMMGTRKRMDELRQQRRMINEIFCLLMILLVLTAAFWVFE